MQSRWARYALARPGSAEYVSSLRSVGLAVSKALLEESSLDIPRLKDPHLAYRMLIPVLIEQYRAVATDDSLAQLTREAQRYSQPVRVPVRHQLTTRVA